MIETIFTLLVVFQIKHWLCDYPLQSQFMLKKFQREGWVLPLTFHAGVHAIFTSLICAVFLGDHYTQVTDWLLVSTPLVLGLLDFTIHFTVDRVKAHPDWGGRYKMDNPKFWWSLGADQGVHHLTHYLIIYIMVML